MLRYMLYLSRKVGESIIVNNTIEMTIMEVKGKSVKIGFDFPPEASILRKEIYERIASENATATSSSADDLLGFEIDVALEESDV